MDVWQAPPETIGALWPHLRPRILSIVQRSHGKLSEGTVLDILSKGEWQCFVAFDGEENRLVIVTCILTYPTGQKWLNGIGASGDGREDWQHEAMAKLEAFARLEGCAGFEMWARPGWEPLMKSKGFRRTHLLLEKIL